MKNYLTTVANIPDTFTLAQGDEAARVLEYFGTDYVNDGYTYVFVLVVEGEYLGAYGAYSAGLDAPAYLIY